MAKGKKRWERDQGGGHQLPRPRVITPLSVLMTAPVFGRLAQKQQQDRGVRPLAPVLDPHNEPLCKAVRLTRTPYPNSPGRTGGWAAVVCTYACGPLMTTAANARNTSTESSGGKGDFCNPRFKLAAACPPRRCGLSSGQGGWSEGRRATGRRG